MERASNKKKKIRENIAVFSRMTNGQLPPPVCRQEKNQPNYNN